MNVNNDKEFDDFLRSALLDGREDVPEGLWEKISKRLDTEEAPRPRGPHRYFWIPALAALALAAVLVFDFRRPAELESAEEPLAEVVLPKDILTEEILTENVLPENILTENVLTEQEVKAPVPVSNPVRAIPLAQYALEASLPPQDWIPAEDDIASKEKDCESPSSSGKDDGQEVTASPEGVKIPETAEWTEPAEASRWHRSSVRLQLAAAVSTGGNLGRHKYSLGKSASGAVDLGGGCKVTETECTFTAIPLCLGVGLKMNFNERWAVGTGLIYTYIGRRFSGTYDDGAIEKYSCGSITNDQHYLGIPLNLYYTFVRSGKFSFYAFGGGTLEKCLTNNYSFDYEGTRMNLGNNVKGVQMSVSLGAGFQFQLSRLIGLYIDPEFKYYFKNSSQPKSIRTTQPFQLGCEAGLRFNI